MTIQEAVNKIIFNGTAIFKNPERLFDNISKESKEYQEEIKRLRTIVDKSVLNLFIDNKLSEKERLSKIKEYLENRHYSENIITFIIETFGLPLGYEKTIEELKKSKIISTESYLPNPQKIEEINLNEDNLRLLGYINKKEIIEFKLNVQNDIVTTPNGKKYKIISIEANTFKDCNSLRQITIPDSVKFIGANAFENCTSLKTIKIPNGVMEIKSKTFCGCKSLAIVNIPDTVKQIGESAFEDCASLSKVTIPNGVIKIEKQTFCGCKSLTSIYIPDSVIEIGAMAFFECESLNNLSIPYKVTNIGFNSFSGCKKLTKITAPVMFFKDELIYNNSKNEAKNINDMINSEFALKKQLYDDLSTLDGIIEKMSKEQLIRLCNLIKIELDKF